MIPTIAPYLYSPLYSGSRLILITIVFLDLRRIGRIEAKGLPVKTMPRVDLEQGCGQNGGTRKSGPSGEVNRRRPEKS